MYLQQEGAISTLIGRPIKLIDRFTYLGNDISSTESDVNMCPAKACTAINRLSIIWKSNLPDKRRWDILEDVAVSLLLYGCTTWTLTKRMDKSSLETTHKCYVLFWINPDCNNPRMETVVLPLTSHLINHPSKTNKLCGVQLEK